MHDDGLNGDAVAEDHVYTLQISFNESAVGQVQLQVSAAFRGQLKRVISPAIQLSVWGAVTDNTLAGFTVLYPPGIYDVTDPSLPGSYDLASSPIGVAIGGAIPDTGSSPESASGFDINISYAPYMLSGRFDINQYLSTTYPGRIVGTSTPIVVGGQQGYEVIFQQEEGGGHPDVVVYHAGYVYEISYNSTTNVVGYSDQAGLALFNQVVQHFAFKQ